MKQTNTENTFSFKKSFLRDTIMFDERQVRQIAAAEGYVVYEKAKGLAFYHVGKKGCDATNEVGPVHISVSFTTEALTIYRKHPKAGSGQMFREVDSLKLLKNIFDNSYLHSSTSYKMTSQTVTGLKNTLIMIALGNEWKQLTVKPQERESLLIFQHPFGRIRVWFKKGMLEIKMGKQMFLKKNLNLAQIIEYFESPWNILEEIENKPCHVPSLTHCRRPLQPNISEVDGSTPYLKREHFPSSYKLLQPMNGLIGHHMYEYKKPLQIDVRTSSILPLASKENEMKALRKPLKGESREIIEALANRIGFFKYHDQSFMLGFKDSEKGATVNVYPSKGTVTVQKQADGSDSSTKNCSLEDFQSILSQHTVTGIAQNKSLTSSCCTSYNVKEEIQYESSIISNITSRSKALSEAMEKARASAAALFRY